MFRFLVSRILTPRQRLVARYHTTPTLNMVRTAPKSLQFLTDFPNPFLSTVGEAVHAGGVVHRRSEPGWRR